MPSRSIQCEVWQMVQISSMPTRKCLGFRSNSSEKRSPKLTRLRAPQYSFQRTIKIIMKTGTELIWDKQEPAPFRITLKELIKQGSQGKVFLAEDAEKNLYAVKVISQDKLDELDGKMGEFVQNEINNLAKISSQNVVNLLYYMRSKNNVYLVYEYCEEGDLYKYLKNKGNLSEMKALEFFIQILNGLRYIHELDILHRDLKLENILLNKEGQIKICDFGFSENQKESSEIVSVGTRGYQAPELIECKEQPTKAADVFSLGVVLYAMLYNCLPFQADSDQQYLDNISEKRIDFKRNNVQISQELQKLLRRMLMKDPESRPKIIELLANPYIEEKCKPKSQTEQLELTQTKIFYLKDINFEELHRKYKIQEAQQDLLLLVCHFIQQNEFKYPLKMAFTLFLITKLHFHERRRIISEIEEKNYLVGQVSQLQAEALAFHQWFIDYKEKTKDSESLLIYYHTQLLPNKLGLEQTLGASLYTHFENNIENYLKNPGDNQGVYQTFEGHMKNTLDSLLKQFDLQSTSTPQKQPHFAAIQKKKQLLLIFYLNAIKSVDQLYINNVKHYLEVENQPEEQIFAQLSNGGVL